MAFEAVDVKLHIENDRNKKKITGCLRFATVRRQQTFAIIVDSFSLQSSLLMIICDKSMILYVAGTNGKVVVLSESKLGLLGGSGLFTRLFYTVVLGDPRWFYGVILKGSCC